MRAPIDKRAVEIAYHNLVAKEQKARTKCENARATRNRNTKTFCKQHAAILQELERVAGLLAYVRARGW